MGSRGGTKHRATGRGGALRRSLKAVVVASVLGASLPVLPSMPPLRLPGFEVRPAAATGGGTVSAWGANTSGQVGDGTTVGPVLSPAELGGVGSSAAVSAGHAHSVAALVDGTVLTWGANDHGQLGDNSITPRSSPVAVAGVTTAAEGAAGSFHSLALTHDGRVLAWGDNFYGQVGDNTTTDRRVPVQVIASAATDVSGGRNHSLALVAGTVYAWGYNNYGQTGSSGTGPPGPSVPMAVAGLASRFVAVAAGADHSLALRDDGQVFSWGRNNRGQLGRNCQFGCIDTYVPAAVPALSGVQAVAAGDDHSLALLADGTVRAWGRNDWGQLGDGATTTSARPTPTAVKGPDGTGQLGGVRRLDGGGSHTVAARTDGRVFAWGANASGQLGAGTQTSYETVPTAYAGPNSVSEVAAGALHTLALNGVPAGGPLTEAEVRGGGSRATRQADCATRDVGQPVNTATGTFWHTFVDLVVPGRGPALAFSRTYNSSAAADGPFGYGWASSYTMTVTTTPSGAVVSEEGGSQVAFDLVGGTYTPVAPRLAATLAAGGAGEPAFTYVRRNREVFTFDAGGRLTSVTDRNGYATRVEYPSATLLTVRDPAGRVVNLTRNATTGRITALAEAAAPGRTMSFAYDPATGDLTDVVDVNGGRWSFGYDGAHRMTRMRSPRWYGVTNVSPTPELTNTYDPLTGRISAQTDAVGRTTTFDYAPAGAPPDSTLITDPKGNKTLDTYAFGVLVAHTAGYASATPSTWRKAFDPVSLGCVRTVDPLGRVASATFDAAGNRTAATDALGRTTTATYTAYHDPETVTDATGVTTTLTYDGINLTSVSTPLLDDQGSVVATRRVQLRYGERGSTAPGDVTTVIDANGQEWRYDHDPATGDVTAAVDPLGQRSTLGYDGGGRLVARTTPRGNAPGADPARFRWTYAYEADNRPRLTTDPLGHATERHYDADRNLDWAQDADGRRTTFDHDPAGQLLTLVRGAGTPEALTEGRDYWPDGALHHHYDGAGAPTTYTYDAQGRPTSVTDPLGRTTTAAYDPAGNPLSRQDPGGNCSAVPKAGCTTMAYDASDQLIAVDYADPTTADVSAVVYDANGRRRAMTDGTGTSTWAWDSLGRLRSTTSGAAVPGGGQTVTYDYQLGGEVSAIGYPGGQTVTRHHDAAGRLDWVGDWLGNRASFGYDDGNWTTKTLPLTSGVAEARTYDPAGRLEAITVTKGLSTVAGFGYARSDAGLVSAVDASGAAGADQSYDYDPLARLCLAAPAAGTCAAPPPAGTAFDHDGADNLAQRGPRAQRFDAAHQLCWQAVTTTGTCASPPAGATRYGYSVRGERTSEAGRWATVGYAYDGAGRLGSTSVTPAASYLGTSGDAPVPADYDGDGRADNAVWRPGTGAWWVTASASGTTGAQSWGLAGDKALPADYDGDGRADRAVWRPSNGGWYVKGSAGTDTTAYLGTSGDTPVPADYDGDGRADRAVWRPGTGAWYIEGSRDGSRTEFWGLSGDVAVPADYDGDGRADVAVWRPSVGGWYVRHSGGGVAQQYLGLAGDAPVPGDYDGDGRADPAVWRRTTGTWYIGSATGALVQLSWGLDGDVPVPADYDGDRRADPAVWRSGAWWVRISGHQGASYAYDGDGLRAARTTAAGTTAFTWDRSGGLPLLLAEGPVGTATRYLYGPGNQPLARITATGQLSWYHADQLGSTRLLTDAAGAVTATYAYDAYGTLTAATGTAMTQPLRFAGEYADTETGLVYLRARYYDPGTGQFLTRDPLEDVTRSAYGYVGGDPMNMIDPSGRFGYRFEFDLGPARLSPEEMMDVLRSDFGTVFPLTGAPGQLPSVGGKVDLAVYGLGFPVTVADTWGTGFRFETRVGHIDWPGWIEFNIFQRNGCLALEIRGHVPDGAFVNLGEFAVFPPMALFRKRIYRGISHHIWGGLVDNLRDVNS